MISISTDERKWLLRNLAAGLSDFMGVHEPPVQVEELLRHPPTLYNQDFGVVDMYSNLWDATFARPPSQRGSVFVRIDLPEAERRFALARETLCALITSKHGRAMGLADLLMDNLRTSAEYFARFLVVPERLLQTYREQGGDIQGFAQAFQIPAEIANLRWEEFDMYLN